MACMELLLYDEFCLMAAERLFSQKRERVRLYEEHLIVGLEQPTRQTIKTKGNAWVYEDGTKSDRIGLN